MTNLREAAQMALDALEDACGNRCNREHNPCFQREAAEALRAVLAQQENQRARDSLPLMVEALEKLEQRQKALAQPEREWQGLTDEDLSVCDEDGVILARYWEAKLREKNT